MIDPLHGAVMMATNQAETPSVHARRVLVPLANPATAMGLIRMAWKLSDVEHGRVLGLFVHLSGTELNEAAFEDLSVVVDKARESGIRIELITRTAPSIARGILDAAREHGATLMVLGFQAPVRGRIELGTVVESVARTTPCDLLVYRNPLGSPVKLEDIEHVILPLDGSDNSKVAARLGVVLADVYDAQPMAMYVQTDSDLPSWFGLARIEASLTALKNTRGIQRQVVRANDMVSGILARCSRSDMVVLGFTEKSPLDRWIFGNVAQRVLAQAPGPVVLVKRATKERMSSSERLTRAVIARFSPRLTPSEQAEVIQQAVEMSRPGINFMVLMLISSVIASFGLLQNSAAVIIGAMLVAPLMSPLMSFSVGLIQGRLRLLRASVLTVLVGVLIGLAVAVVIGVVIPLDVSTSEMRARGEPSLLDMGIALASGAAGAYAMARKDIPSALAGVAIAAALVPPLCTVGLGLAFRDWDLASGAGLLFLTNIVSISLMGAAIFGWLGLRPRREHYTWRQVLISLLVLGLLAIPLGSAFVDVVRTGRQTGQARDVLEAQFSDADIIEVELKGHDITATVRSTRWLTSHDVNQAERALEDALGFDVDLAITNWRAVESRPADE
ncbi:MAG: TIGR00341 family protein [Anaerolineae bacterium]|nr:TIGR00341 family protein [Anaerolineae bacterium]